MMLLARLPHGIMFLTGPPQRPPGGEEMLFLPAFLGTGMIPLVLAALLGIKVVGVGGRSWDGTAQESQEGLSY